MKVEWGATGGIRGPAAGMGKEGEETMRRINMYEVP